MKLRSGKRRNSDRDGMVDLILQNQNQDLGIDGMGLRENYQPLPDDDREDAPTLRIFDGKEHDMDTNEKPTEHRAILNFRNVCLGIALLAVSFLFCSKGLQLNREHNQEIPASTLTTINDLERVKYERVQLPNGDWYECKPPVVTLGEIQHADEYVR